jgi:hypothetical protein
LPLFFLSHVSKLTFLVHFTCPDGRRLRVNIANQRTGGGGGGGGYGGGGQGGYGGGCSSWLSFTSSRRQLLTLSVSSFLLLFRRRPVRRLRRRTGRLRWRTGWLRWRTGRLYVLSAHFTPFPSLTLFLPSPSLFADGGQSGYGGGQGGYGGQAQSGYPAVGADASYGQQGAGGCSFFSLSSSPLFFSVLRVRATRFVSVSRDRTDKRTSVTELCLD